MLIKCSPFPYFVDSPFRLNFFSGSFAGTISAILTLPIDVIKTRQQMGIDGLNGNGNSSKTLREIITTLYSQEGPRGFFRGIGPRVAKAAPACGIMIASFQLCKNFLLENQIKF